MIYKKLCLVLCIFCGLETSAANSRTDSIVQIILNEKDIYKRIDLMIEVYSPETESQPFSLIQIGKALQDAAETKHDSVMRAMSYSYLGHGYRLIGNISGALQWHLKALELAEKLSYPSVIALIENQCGHIYKDREEHEKAKEFYFSSLTHANAGSNKRLAIFPLMNLAAVYLNMRKIDSALMYAQRAYEISIISPKRSGQAFIEMNLASIHSLLGNNDLASSYFRSSLKLANDYKSSRYKSMANHAFAEHFLRLGKTDSAAIYANRAIADVRNTVFFYLTMKPAELLLSMAKSGNCDSISAYTNLYKAAKDSLFNHKVNQQVQLMTYEEERRQSELALHAEKEKENRRLNLQYGLIAVGLMIFLTIYFVLSQSVILSEKWISFFGILGLLGVFEFVNLLIHPQLGAITHHSPPLMLAAMILIAALLIPLHHKLETWIKVIMVARHRKKKLENAKKVIEDFEK